MPVTIEGEAIIIDDGKSDRQSILSSWLEPLPEAYKARRAWMALGAGILVSILFAYLGWKLYLLNQLLSPRGVLSVLGIIVAPVIGIYRWKFWITHPQVRRYAKITTQGFDQSLNLSSWWSRLRTDPLSELTPEAQADFQFYEAERRAEFRQRWQTRISWLMDIARERTVRFPLAIVILIVDFVLRYYHQITIIEMGGILIAAVLVAYEMIILLLIYIPVFFLISRYIPYPTLVPISVALFIGIIGISIAMKAESRN